MSNNTAVNFNTYDEVPYESYPYAQSHPSHLRTLGLLFGMKPIKIETARILELGCAAGGNLLPIAMNYPKSYCVGIDLSKVQIDKADQQVKDLKLQNITFLNQSITELDESLGKFDYIICHGVISWVPEDVRSKILEVSNKFLSENGIAYISYNTLPGWNMVRSIREMMLYHITNFSSVNEKINQARLLLNFLKDSTESHNTPYAKFLQNEATLLANQEDHYLRHDHLEENNHQYYFSDFMAMAGKNELQYLADASLPSMFLGNLPAKVAEKFAEIKDIVRTEQYMDYLNNRRFRATLLCHNDVKLNRNLSPDLIKDFYLSALISPEKPLADININDNSNLTFYINNNKEVFISTSSPALKAVLYTFAANPNRSLKLEEWVKLASKNHSDISVEQAKAELMNNALRLVLSGFMQINSEAEFFDAEVNEQPKVAPLVRYQAEHGTQLWVTNLKHERLGINIFDKFAIRHLDGHTSKDKLMEHLVNYIQKGELNLIQNDQKITDEDLIKKELVSIIDQLFIRIAQSALLIK